MNIAEPGVQSPVALNTAARNRRLDCVGEPLLLADWDRVLMLQFEVDPESLQRETSYELDLRDGRGLRFVGAFTMRGRRFHPKKGP